MVTSQPERQRQGTPVCLRQCQGEARDCTCKATPAAPSAGLAVHRLALRAAEGLHKASHVGVRCECCIAFGHMRLSLSLSPLPTQRQISTQQLCHTFSQF